MAESAAWTDYRQRVESVRRALVSLPTDAPIRLNKGAKTSNLFRPRDAAHTALNADGFSGVLDIDVTGKTANVLAMTTYEDLLTTLLPYGLAPLVVPQLKTITIGGAVTGLGIESSSWRNGCPHESVLEMDILTGDGRILTVTPDNEYRDLFYGFTNSYGTLGYALRLKIELEPVTKYVHLRHVRFTNVPDCAAAIETVCSSREWEGQKVEFVDGTWFSADECYLTLADYAATAPRASDYTGQEIYYRSIQQRSEDWVTAYDYFWRWDTDWFWCSRAFGAQNPRIRRVWPKRLRRSDVYWKLIGLERKYGVKRRIDRRAGKPPEEEVIQDVEIPVSRLAEFIEFLDQRTGIQPVWMCPLKQRNPDATWDLYSLQPATLYVNVGFWSTAVLPPGASDGFHNRAIEQKVSELGGRKSLYSTAFYPEEEFWANYGGDTYEVLKKTYDPDGRLLNLFEKTVQRR